MKEKGREVYSESLKVQKKFKITNDNNWLYFVRQYFDINDYILTSVYDLRFCGLLENLK